VLEKISVKSPYCDLKVQGQVRCTGISSCSWPPWRSRRRRSTKAGNISHWSEVRNL